MDEPLDEQLINIMEHLFDIIQPHKGDLTDVELRCLIVSTNLRGLAETLLVADDKKMPADLKKTALGLLGTADWLKGDIEPPEDGKVKL